MITIEFSPHTGKWTATVFGEVIGDKYTSPSQASAKVTKFLKGQGK